MPQANCKKKTFTAQRDNLVLGDRLRQAAILLAHAQQAHNEIVDVDLLFVVFLAHCLATQNDALFRCARAQKAVRFQRSIVPNIWTNTD